jgi:hypothetical protein
MHLDLTVDEKTTLREIEHATVLRREMRAVEGALSMRQGRRMVMECVAAAIVDRWYAAGYTTASLVDGLPRPERPHVAEYLDGRCLTCGRHQAANHGACPGADPTDLVFQALQDGVRFDLVGALPTAGGEKTGPAGVRRVIARVTCQPVAKCLRRAA